MSFKDKSPAMKLFIDNWIKQNAPNGGAVEDRQAEQRCAWCGGDASTFTDALSKKEYEISGLCQSCQDETFGEPEE